MDHNIINGINEAYASIQEAYTVQGHARIGSTAAKATDKSVSSAVDKALANRGTAVSASSQKGKTGVTGGGSFRMSGSIGGGKSKPKPNPAPTGGSRPKPQPTPAAKPTSAPRVQNPAASPARRVQNPAASTPTRRPGGASALGGGMSIARGGAGRGMMRMDTMSDVDTYDLVLEYLLDEGFASTEQSADKIILNMSEAWFEDIVELYKGKHGQSEKEYMDSRSDAGKQISGDSKMSGAAYSHRSFKGQGKPAKPGERQTAQGRMTNADRTELMIRKNALRKDAEAKALKKEDFELWVNGLVEEGYDLSDYTWDEMSDIYDDMINENRRAARSAGGYKDDSKKQPDPSKDGFTGVGNMSIKDIMALNKKIEARKAKKEETQVEGEVLEAAVPHTNVYYDKHMKRIVPMGGGTAVPRASKKPDKKPTTQVAHYEPEGELVDEGREEDAKKSLDAVKKRQEVLDAHEKKTGKKLDITKTPEYKSHKQNFPGAKRTGKKEKGAKETPLETHNRRVNKTVDRIIKKGYTSKEKKYNAAMAKHTSPRD